MRLFISAIFMTLGFQALAECGNLCDMDWWKTTTTVDVKAQLDAGADIMARSMLGDTPLPYATAYEKNLA